MTKFRHPKRKYTKEANDIDSPRLKRQKHLSSSINLQSNTAGSTADIDLFQTCSAANGQVPASNHFLPQSPQAEEDISAQRSYASAQALLQDYIPIIQKFINRERPMPCWTAPGPQTGARPLRSKQLGTDWFGYQIHKPSLYFQLYRHQSELTSRIILDSMCHNWGLYFAPNPIMHQDLGSCDIQLALEASFEVIPDADRHSDKVEPVGRLMFGSVLLARFLVLQLFMEGSTPGNVQQRRTKWVVAQQAPHEAFRGLDIFALLSQDLRALLPHDDIVLACHHIWRCILSPVLRKFSGASPTSLSVVLDWGDQATPQRAPRAKRTIAMRAGLSCWTSILPFHSGARFQVVCDKLMYLLAPDPVLKLSRERQDGPEDLPNVCGSLQFRDPEAWNRQLLSAQKAKLLLSQIISSHE